MITNSQCFQYFNHLVYFIFLRMNSLRDTYIKEGEANRTVANHLLNASSKPWMTNTVGMCNFEAKDVSNTFMDLGAMTSNAPTKT